MTGEKKKPQHLQLRPGTRLSIEIEPVEGRGLRVTPRLRFGTSGVEDLDKPQFAASELKALELVEVWAQECQARIGLDQT